MEKTIQEAVAEQISNSGAKVAEIVIDKMAQIEIDKRVATIQKAILKQDELTKDLKKIDKEDFVTYAAGNQVSVMSKERFEQIKKLKEKIQKLVAATNAALNDNTHEAYTKLEEALKKLNNAGGNTKEDSAESEQ